jgi:hypothetical protein
MVLASDRLMHLHDDRSIPRDILDTFWKKIALIARLRPLVNFGAFGGSKE